MTRSDQQRFDDILIAIRRCQACAPHLRSGKYRDMAYDAVLRKLPAER